MLCLPTMLLVEALHQAKDAGAPPKAKTARFQIHLNIIFLLAIIALLCSHYFISFNLMKSSQSGSCSISVCVFWHSMSGIVYPPVYLRSSPVGTGELGNQEKSGKRLIAPKRFEYEQSFPAGIVMTVVFGLFLRLLRCIGFSIRFPLNWLQKRSRYWKSESYEPVRAKFEIRPKKASPAKSMAILVGEKLWFVRRCSPFGVPKARGQRVAVRGDKARISQRRQIGQ